MNINLLKTRYKDANPSGDNQISDIKPEKKFENTSEPQVGTTGVWGKIKKIFSS